MSEAYLTNWSFGGETPGSRNRFHDVALHEARIASDYHSSESHASASALPARPSFVARLRQALAGAGATEGCNCPA